MHINYIHMIIKLYMYDLNITLYKRLRTPCSTIFVCVLQNQLKINEE